MSDESVANRSSRASSESSAVVVRSEDYQQSQAQQLPLPQAQPPLPDQEQSQQLQSQANLDATNQQPITIVQRVSLCAVRLSESMAQKLVSAVATAGLVSTVVPASVVNATALVAEVQTQSAWAVANRLLVHIPSDAISVKLMRKLVMSYASVNPSCFNAFRTMTATQAAATTALGGAVPLLVAAALQESIEVSRLIAGKSNKEQFARASAFLAAQVAGGLTGLAAGAVAGTMILPGIGTGIGSFVGSYAGATVIPWFVGGGSSGTSNRTRKISSASSARQQPQVQKQSDQQQQKEEEKQTPQLQQPPSSQPAETAVEASDVETAKILSQSSQNNFSFFWMEEVTPEGFVLVNSGAEDPNESENDGGDDEAHDSRQTSQAQSSNTANSTEMSEEARNAARAEFVSTARLLLYRSTIVPMEDVQRHLQQQKRNSQSFECKDQQQQEQNDVDEASALFRHLPGTVLVLRSEVGALAALSSVDHVQQQQEAAAAASLPRSASHPSRVFFAESEKDEQPDRVRVEADIAGHHWSLFR